MQSTEINFSYDGLNKEELAHEQEHHWQNKPLCFVNIRLCFHTDFYQNVISGVMQHITSRSTAILNIEVLRSESKRWGVRVGAK